MTSKKSNGGDRISPLSDSILHHILSFLHTKSAVQTSVLSSRWRHLWKSMPHLIFDKKITPNAKSFAGLVYEVLLFRQTTSHIHSFRLLSMDDTDDARDLYNWIVVAIGRNVKEIEIDLLTYNPIKLPNSLFTCQTLTSLELSSSSSIQKLELPDKISLPMLETLSLDSFSFGDVEAVNKLISGCPVLLRLEILGCDLDVEGCLVIDAPTLLTLAVEYGANSGGLLDLHKCEIRINAPNLDVFWCADYIARKFTFVGERTLLDSAEIYLVANGNDFFAPLLDLSISEDEGEKKEHARRCTSLLGAVCGTKRLHLGAWMLLNDSSGKLLNWDEEIFNSANVVGESQWFPKRCIFHHLKVIEIHDVIGYMNEFNVLEFLLENALILEKIIIWTSNDISCDRKKGLINFSKALLKIPRASSDIVILFF
ncbi:hypothetical protein Sjap_002848 [Stephania japonica]|uniref:F-box domain-containing protein n=1 Tax=Stephania japonica TaxID=461633 RepID=A0AAP0KMM8_9MAGN